MRGQPIDGICPAHGEPEPCFTCANLVSGYDEPEDGGAASDPVNHPRHYNEHGSGVECIDIVEWFGFNLGNVIKYVWRADEKGGLEDLRKAAWYIAREIDRREKSAGARS